LYDLFVKTSHTKNVLNISILGNCIQVR